MTTISRVIDKALGMVKMRDNLFCKKLSRCGYCHKTVHETHFRRKLTLYKMMNIKTTDRATAT